MWVCVSFHCAHHQKSALQKDVCVCAGASKCNLQRELQQSDKMPLEYFVCFFPERGGWATSKHVRPSAAQTFLLGWAADLCKTCARYNGNFQPKGRKKDFTRFSGTGVASYGCRWILWGRKIGTRASENVEKCFFDIPSKF